MALKAQRWTISSLAVELGKDKRTMARLVADVDPVYVDGKSSYYLMKDAVDRLVSDKGKKLDPSQEAAKLNQARRTKVEIETLIIKGDLCRTEDVAHWWMNATSAAKTKFLAMPTRLAHQVLSATEYGETERILKECVNEALDELAGRGRPDTP